METYNGWTNWSTWNVNLWVSSDESNYFAMRDLTPFDNSTAESFVRDIYPDGTPDMDDPAEMNEVDWSEIAESFNEE